MNRNHDVITFISQYLDIRKPRVSIFVPIIKIITIFIKTIFKDSKTVKRTRNYVLKCHLYLYFLITKYVDFY